MLLLMVLLLITTVWQCRGRRCGCCRCCCGLVFAFGASVVGNVVYVVDAIGFASSVGVVEWSPLFLRYMVGVECVGVAIVHCRRCGLCVDVVV